MTEEGETRQTDGLPPTVAIDRLAAELDFKTFVEQWNLLQGYQTPTLHLAILAWLEAGAERSGSQQLLMVFRNAGKSTLVALYAAWRLKRAPDLRILVLSADQPLACKMSRNIRRIVERHPATSALRPKRREQWAADQFTIERSLSLRDPSIMARGITANITGSRADLVICDDVEVPNTADSPGKREELRERLGEIPFVLVPGGAQLFVGTPHTYHSIYTDAAIEDGNETRSPFLAGFDRLVLPIFDEEGRSRWPERFTSGHIDDILKRTGPAAFQSQMLLRPNAGHLVRLDPEKLRLYESEIVFTVSNGAELMMLDGNRLVSGVSFWDPAYGRDEQADASVIALVYLDDDGHYWLHAMSYLRIKEDASEDAASQQCRAVARFLKENRQGQIIIENNGIGHFLPSTLRRVLREERHSAGVIARSSTGRKSDRILNAFDPIMAGGRLHVHRRIWETPFIREMREWSPIRSSADDGLDAVSSSLRHLPHRWPRQPDIIASEGAPSPTFGGGSRQARTDFAL